jgi:hypothetical protein
VQHGDGGVIPAAGAGGRRSAPPAPADEVDGGHGETRQRRRFDWPQLPAPAGEVDGGLGEAAAQV